jgi:chemotaxis protein histidine kinase CheA
MAQDIEVKIKVDTSQAVSGVNKLEQGLKGATTQSTALGNTMQGSKQSEFINQLGDGVSKLNPAFGAAVKGANGLILKMWEMVANPVGAILAGIVVTAKFLYEAFQSSVAGGKELKAIFAAISAVGTQVKDAMFGLGRALIDVVSAAYKFITLDFKGAAEDMKKANGEATESYKQLGKAVDGTTAKIIFNLTKQQQANDKARKIQDLTQAKTNLLLVKSREILSDETASLKDKKIALEAVTKAEIASSKEKERIALKDLQIAKVKAKTLGGEEEKKAKAELRQLEIEYTNAQTENAQTGFKLNKQKKMLGRQEAADAKEKNDAIAASNKEVADKRNAQFKIEEDERKRVAKENLDLIMASAKEVMDKEKQLRESKETPAQKEQREYDEWLIKYEANNLNTDLLTKTHEEYLAQQKADADKLKLEKETKAEEEAKAKRDKQIQEEQDAQRRKYEALSLIAQNGMNFMAALQDMGIAKGKAGQVAMKALALAQIGIDTAQAFSNAVPMAIKAGAEAAKLAGPGAPIAGPLATAASYLSSATMIASNIAKAKKLLGSGGGSGGASTPSASGAGGVSAPASAQPSINVVGASKTNAIAETIAQQGQQPIKAYVVANDVTTQQGLDRNIVSSASIG